MSYGIDENGNTWGFTSVGDWFDSVIESFPTPWIIADDTHYGTGIFDSRGCKVLSVWMAWGNPSERQRGSMSDAEWLEYCCDSHWESETQWHIANAIVTARNYLAAHKERGWYGDDDEPREILRNLIMAHGRWEHGVDAEIACGGPQRRMTASEHDKSDASGSRSPYAGEYRARERAKILEKIRAVTPAVAVNPAAAESQNRKAAMCRAMWRITQERPAIPVTLNNGLKVDAFVVMDKPYFKRLSEIAEQEYDDIKREQEPGKNTKSE